LALQRQDVANYTLIAKIRCLLKYAVFSGFLGKYDEFKFAMFSVLLCVLWYNFLQTCYVL